ncbi:hypothetical protein PXK00_02555 [Phaeobacter sp. QD34_3]|uniref:hypothetical protein n=1 Tax=unclassified Phaeobacter TaxID=2621772 RepID=UPI00237EFE37|nr:MULTISPECIES: hypothetical protein [unclassified Phaeobacter]MDE4131975.1 hypothetical protein [Phaeobacter sp. QD34_3]MDE4135613.1 hypothetical protein [Phaeobacter sp. QD34_24]
MSTALPEYYFRVRDNGAFVFRVDTENRQRRIDMDQIAVVNIRNGEIRAHGDRELSSRDLAEIKAWMDERSETLARREVDDIHRAVDHLNLTTHWVQSRASDAQLEEVTDALLMAMHDLRSVLVRKKADRLMRQRKD